MPLPRPSEHYFKKLNLELTSRCNLRCPDCSAGIGITRKGPALQDHPIEYFEVAARYLQGFDSVVAIGGEPTMSRHFAEVAPALRSLFNCRELVLWTNGFKVEQYADLIRDTFDAVYVSRYDSDTGHEWNKHPNTAAVDFIKISFPHSTMEEPHVSLSRRGSGDICGRGEHGPIAYADGLLYPCCVGMGLPNGRGIPLTETWREEILKVNMPCEECCFSPAA